MSSVITILAVLLVGRGVVQTFTKDLWWAWVRLTGIGHHHQSRIRKTLHVYGDLMSLVRVSPKYA